MARFEVTTRNGRTIRVESNISNTAAAAVLADSRSEFARDLANRVAFGYRLSRKQTAWLHVMAQQHCERVAREESRPDPEAIDVSKIVAMFESAGEALRYPKVKLTTSEGTTVQFARAGSRSRYTGAVMITDGGRYGENRYYGRIDCDGWHKRDVPADVESLVRSFAENPEATAAEFGRLNGSCCFCSRRLEDERSTAVGYGPVCAENYGLSWGSTVRNERATVAAETPAAESTNDGLTVADSEELVVA